MKISLGANSHHPLAVANGITQLKYLHCRGARLGRLEQLANQLLHGLAGIAYVVTSHIKQVLPEANCTSIMAMRPMENSAPYFRQPVAFPFTANNWLCLFSRGHLI